MPVQSQPSAGFAQGVTLNTQSVLEIIPTIGKCEILSEKCPQGRDEPLISPYGLFRSAAPKQIALDGPLKHMLNRDILVGCNFAQGIKRCLGQRKHNCNFFHTNTITGFG